MYVGFLEKLGKTIDVWLSTDSAPESKNNNNQSSGYKQEQYRSSIPKISSNKEKGDKFERYVVDIFKKQDKFFDIVDWTSDNCNKRKGIYIESDRNPDLRMRYKWKGKDEQFAVECKYRSGLHKNSRFNEAMLHWSYPEGKML